MEWGEGDFCDGLRLLQRTAFLVFVLLALKGCADDYVFLTAGSFTESSHRYNSSKLNWKCRVIVVTSELEAGLFLYVSWWPLIIVTPLG